MNNKYDVSIIIPTWNVEGYQYGNDLAIKNLIRSIYKQVSDGFSFETIFVDDFSTDNTKNIITKEIEKYPKIHGRLFNSDKKSGNPTRGRNLGIEYAQGEYIFFMDHDDQMGDDQSLVNIFNYAKQWDSDVIIGKKAGLGLAQELYGSGNMEIVNYNKVNPIQSIGIFGNLYRLSTINIFNVRFPEENPRYEDFSFFANMLLIPEIKVSLVTDYNYYYYLNELVDNDNGHLSEVVYNASHIEVLDQILNILKNFGKSNNVDLKAAILETILYRWPIKRLMRPCKKRQKELIMSNKFWEMKNLFESNVDEKVLQRLPFKRRLLAQSFLLNEYVDAIESYQAVHFLVDRQSERNVELNYFTSQSALDELITKFKYFKSSKVYSKNFHIKVDQNNNLIVLASFNTENNVYLVFIDRSSQRKVKFSLNSGRNDIEFLPEFTNCSHSTKFDLFIEEKQQYALIDIRLDSNAIEKETNNDTIHLFKNYKAGISMKLK